MKRSWLLLGIAVFMLFASLPVMAGEVENFTPVTDEMLINAEDDPNNWLMWRRTYNAWGYSPLDQINRWNVEDLQVAWARNMEPGPQESTPLVYNGVMYLAHSGDVVQALDATNGDLIWEYWRQLPNEEWSIYAANRNPAIYEDKVIIGTTDAYLVALNAKTGQVEWEQQVADYKQGFRYTAGPLVVDGKVIAGMSGCTSPAAGGCFISGHDAETGEELWRTYTTARPGEPGGDTWADLPVESRMGGSAWITGSYDPELGLVYWGVAQPIPWVRELRGTGNDDANLYTNSTLALDPDTGEIVWYYQFNPGETWDLDEHYEQMLIDAEFDGEPRKLLVTSGKRGIQWVLDRETGELLSATETIYQNTLEIDQETLEVTEVSELIPGIGDPRFICPTTLGGRDWQATAYSPLTGAVYMPMNNACMDFESLDIEPTLGQSFGAGRSVFRHAPGSDGQVGRVDAIHVTTGDELWSYDQRMPWTGALVATGGGLVFGGDEDRRLRAFDAWTGEVLWEVPLNTAISGYPISYAVDGKQYVAVPVGGGGVLSFRSLVPELTSPIGGSMIWVFALPEK